jgi:two-component system NtrC family sensor kinase
MFLKFQKMYLLVNYLSMLLAHSKKEYYLFKRIRVVIFLTFLFFVLVLANYFINLYILKSAIHDFQVQTIENGSNRIVKWLKKNIDVVQIVQSLVDGRDHKGDQELIQTIIENSSSLANFAYMFIAYDDNITISSEPLDNPLVHATVTKSWYKETVANEGITFTEPYLSITLNSIVVSICMPTKDQRAQNGVLCGVLPLDYIKKEILSISLPYEGRAFLVDKHHKILVHKEDQQLFKTFLYTLENKYDLITTDVHLKNYIFSHGFIDYAKWHLVLQLDKNKAYERANIQLLLSFLIYGTSLIVFFMLFLFYNRNQRLSDKKLKKAQALLQCFIQSDERGFLIADNNHNITYYNNEFSRLLEIPGLKLNLLNLSEASIIFQSLPFGICDSLDKMLKATMKKEKIHTNTFSFSYKQIKKYLFFTSIPVKDSSGKYNGTILIIENVEEKVLKNILKLEQEAILFQQSKMADLGEMLGAISHQWSQPLNAISILLGNLLQFKEIGCLEDAILKENLEHALSNTRYLSSTIDTFRDFYRPDKKIQSFDIIEAISHTIFILEPYFKNTGIKIDIVEDKMKYNCYNYKNEFQQVIASLMINSKDALRGQTPHKHKYIKIHIEESDGNYQIKIEDNGSGIDLSIKEALFNSFETTKGAKGTGNGLYLSKLIARKKLFGDLVLLSSSSPTVFLLSMSKKLKDEK